MPAGGLADQSAMILRTLSSLGGSTFLGGSLDLGHRLGYRGDRPIGRLGSLRAADIGQYGRDQADGGHRPERGSRHRHPFGVGRGRKAGRPALAGARPRPIGFQSTGRPGTFRSGVRIGSPGPLHKHVDRDLKLARQRRIGLEYDLVDDPARLSARDHLDEHPVVRTFRAGGLSDRLDGRRRCLEASSRRRN